MPLFKLWPQAATDVEKGRLLQRAVRDCDSGLDLIMPISAVDRVVAAFKAVPSQSGEARLRALVEAQCGPLSMVLSNDVMGVVYEYLFGGKLVRGFAREWFEAVENGDGKLAAQLLNDDPALIDTIFRDAGYLALTFAFQLEDFVVTHPSAFLGDFDGATALIQAASRGDVDMVEIFLAACPSTLDEVDREHHTAMLHAACSNFHEVVSVLLAANPKNVQCVDLMDWNVLHRLVSFGHVTHVASVLAIDPSLVRTVTGKLQTPLWLAVDKGHNELIEKLFFLFPQAVRMAAADGVTPYHRALQQQSDFALGLFLPKLTFEEIALGYRRYRVSRDGVVDDVIDESIVEVLELVLFELPTILDSITAYLGFGTLYIATKITPKRVFQ